MFPEQTENIMFAERPEQRRQAAIGKQRTAEMAEAQAAIDKQTHRDLKNADEEDKENLHQFTLWKREQEKQKHQAEANQNKINQAAEQERQKQERDADHDRKKAEHERQKQEREEDHARKKAEHERQKQERESTPEAQNALQQKDIANRIMGEEQYQNQLRGQAGAQMFEANELEQIKRRVMANSHEANIRGLNLGQLVDWAMSQQAAAIEQGMISRMYGITNRNNMTTEIFQGSR